LRLAEQGCFVAVGFASNVEAAQETIRLLDEVGAARELLPLDVAETESCTQAVEGILERHGRIDILVNNAGAVGDALIVRQKDEDWNRLLAVNLAGPMALCRAAARPMMKQRAGAIVNVVSISGEMGNAGQSAYAASKAGLIGMTKSLARELAPRGIRVNAVSPGFIDTDMTSGLTDALRERILGQIPLARLGRSDEVAQAIAFLASDAASYITGEVLRVNGGLLT
jgi:3-oxoacyl-[acyl-carrier protein] reductase